MKLLSFSALLCLLAFAPAFAQKSFQDLPRRTCGECTLVKEYDSVHNHTRVHLKLMPVTDVPGGKLYLTLSRNVSGPPDGGPAKVVYAGLTFVAKERVEIRETELLMVADGSPISLGHAPLAATTQSGPNVISTYFSSADWESVAKLGLAKRLEMRFGGIVVQFSDEHLAAIRDFLSYAEGSGEKAEVPALAPAQEVLRRACRECVVTKAYDPLIKATRVMLNPMVVADVPGGKMYLSLGTTYAPDKPNFKRVVSVFVTVVAERLVEAKDTELRVQADGDTLDLGRMAQDSTDTEGALKVSGYSGMADLAEVSKLGQAKNVEMSFGGIKFRLTDEHKAAILDFLSYAEGNKP